MSRELLATRLASGAQHLSPFLVLGDPDPATSIALCVAAVEAGASMLELGLPYATPSADGPAVQAASMRALRSGVDVASAWSVLRAVRERCPDVPCNLLVYANLVHARGPDRFAREAVAAGASSLLVPDVPLEEGEELRAACLAHGLGVVMLAGPRTPLERLRTLAAAADNFVYLAGHQGVTGARDLDWPNLAARVRTAKAAVTSPLCIGFGLSTREDLDEVFTAGADIAVVGSHLLRVIATARATGSDVVDAYVTALRALAPESKVQGPSPISSTVEVRENPSCS
ncbi:MAG: tryptophan synthase subunit alpha [Planctomycetota bacterium]